MQLPLAILSRHARERVLERFKISPAKLAGLMDEGLGKKIGVSAASNIIHRLLWSPDDSSLLVAIQEVVSGTVLTVLTLDMYKRDYAENILETRVRHVINQMVHAGHAPSAMWQTGDKQEYITVHAHHAANSRPIAIGRWAGSVVSPDLSQLGALEEFWCWVAQRLEEKHHPVEGLMGIEARFNGGQNFNVPYLLSDKAK